MADRFPEEKGDDRFPEELPEGEEEEDDNDDENDDAYSKVFTTASSLLSNYISSQTGGLVSSETIDRAIQAAGSIVKDSIEESSSLLVSTIADRLENSHSNRRSYPSEGELTIEELEMLHVSQDHPDNNDSTSSIGTNDDTNTEDTVEDSGRNSIGGEDRTDNSGDSSEDIKYNIGNGGRVIGLNNTDVSSSGHDVWDSDDVIIEDGSGVDSERLFGGNRGRGSDWEIHDLGNSTSDEGSQIIAGPDDNIQLTLHNVTPRSHERRIGNNIKTTERRTYEELENDTPGYFETEMLNNENSFNTKALSDETTSIQPLHEIVNNTNGLTQPSKEQSSDKVSDTSVINEEFSSFNNNDNATSLNKPSNSSWKEHLSNSSLQDSLNYSPRGIKSDGTPVGQGYQLVPIINNPPTIKNGLNSNQNESEISESFTQLSSTPNARTTKPYEYINHKLNTFDANEDMTAMSNVGYLNKISPPRSFKGKVIYDNSVITLNIGKIIINGSETSGSAQIPYEQFKEEYTPGFGSNEKTNRSETRKQSVNIARDDDNDNGSSLKIYERIANSESIQNVKEGTDYIKVRKRN